MKERSCNNGGMVIKLDFEKPYDCIDSGFLMFVMRKMGFGEKWQS